MVPVGKRKGTYKITNWSKYNKSLIDRGDITVWFSDEVISDWRHSNKGFKAGRPFTFSDTAIETMLVLRELFKLPYRQDEFPSTESRLPRNTSGKIISSAVFDHEGTRYIWPKEITPKKSLTLLAGDDFVVIKLPGDTDEKCEGAATLRAKLNKSQLVMEFPKLNVRMIGDTILKKSRRHSG